MTPEAANLETAVRSPRTLKISTGLIALLEQHAERSAPAECVGLLFGCGDRAFRHVPLTNIAETPETHFYADPGEVLRALMGADRSGDTLLGVYHSHPKGPNELSERDLQHAQPGLVQLLLAPDGIVAFEVVGRAAQEVRLES